MGSAIELPFCNRIMSDQFINEIKTSMTVTQDRKAARKLVNCSRKEWEDLPGTERVASGLMVKAGYEDVQAATLDTCGFPSGDNPETRLRGYSLTPGQVGVP